MPGEKTRARHRLFKMFKRLTDTANDAVIVADPQSRIVYWNRGAKRLTGYGSSEMLGRTHPADALTLLDNSGRPIKDDDGDIAAAIESGEVVEKTAFIENRSGQRLPVRIHIGPLRDAEGHVVGVIETLHDNTRLASATQRIEELVEVAI